MKIETHKNAFRAFTLLLTAFCLTAGIPDAVAQDANTIVYVDALWCRVHAADCPDLILKEHKQTMTLGEADQLGYRIGESGQSGRTDCCLQGYQREYYTARNVDAYYDTTYVNPGNSSITTVEGALISSNAIGVVELMGDGDHKYHVYGCHRFTPDLQDQRMTLADARGESGFYICQHCIERGPGFAQMSDEEWAKLPSGLSWTPPAGWTPSSFSADTIPPQEEIDILLSETLHGAIGIQESVYTNPVATVENFMIMRFFFPVHRWLELYQAYRCTGDTNVLEQLRGSARHYNTLSKNYLSAAQKQARDPEGMAYMYTMAASARITLQLARKYPEQVTTNELAEAEDFLMTIMSVLQPACEGNDNLDPSMGIPKPLADDFRGRAFNRALNGIGTIGMATAALQDLQVLNSTTAYQPTIDRYRKVIQEYIKNWKSEGFEETVDGKDYFSYPYSAGSVQWVGDVKLFAADDQGHFSHSMQGCYVLYDSVPELVDDAFMTALANTIHFNSYTTSGSPQTPSQEAIRPYSRKSFSLPSDRLYLLNAFNDGVIDGQCSKLSSASKTATNSQYEYRRATLNALYLTALRQDRTLIHLADEGTIPPAAPTGLAATAGDGEVTLDWDDNSESNLAGYRVYRSTTSGSYGTALATNVSLSAYTDSTAVNGTTYYYVVAAVDTSSNESAQSSEDSATPADTTAPAAPTGLAAAAGDGEVSLNWNDNSEGDLDSYSVYRSTTSGSYGSALATNVGVSQYTDSSAANGTTYYYVVTAVDSASLESAQSAEVSATPQADTTPPAAPTGLTALASDGSVALDWNNNGEDDLDSYSVYRSTTSGSYGAALATGLQSSQYIDSSVDNGTTYYYVVTAVDASTNENESVQSAEVSATPQEAAGFSDVTIFGSNKDGLGEFAKSAEATANEIWATETESVKYRNQDTGTLNSSLLKEITLDRSNGKSYTIEGVVHLTDGYVDDNNRVGIYLFGDSSMIPNEDEVGAIGVIFNTDDSSSGGSPGVNNPDAIYLKVGIDSTALSANVTRNQTVPYAQDLFGTEITLKADIVFTNDSIVISVALTEQSGAETVIIGTNAITVAAEDYTGDFFGFVTRARARNWTSDATGTPEGRSRPWVMDYKRFSVTENGGTMPPEPYEEWVIKHKIQLEGEMLNDPDADGAVNLYEYGLGGNPTNSAVQGTLPTLTKFGNRFIYVHPKRSDDTLLVYTVETTTNLMDSGSWTNEGYVVLGTNVTGGELNFVTNDVDTAHSERFIRLKIEQ